MILYPIKTLIPIFVRFTTVESQNSIQVLKWLKANCGMPAACDRRVVLNIINREFKSELEVLSVKVEAVVNIHKVQSMLMQLVQKVMSRE